VYKNIEGGYKIFTLNILILCLNKCIKNLNYFIFLFISISFFIFYNIFNILLFSLIAKLSFSILIFIFLIKLNLYFLENFKSLEVKILFHNIIRYFLLGLLILNLVLITYLSFQLILNILEIIFNIFITNILSIKYSKFNLMEPNKTNKEKNLSDKAAELKNKILEIQNNKKYSNIDIDSVNKNKNFERKG
jgi:hypothetical protein